MTHYLVRIGLVFGVALPAVLFVSIVVTESVVRGGIVFALIWAAGAVGARLPDGFLAPDDDGDGVDP